MAGVDAVPDIKLPLGSSDINWVTHRADTKTVHWPWTQLILHHMHLYPAVGAKGGSKAHEGRH